MFIYCITYCIICYKINPNRGAWYIDSPDWIKSKKAIINHINKKDNKCFQCAVTVTLNFKETKKDPQKITKIKPSISTYNWKRINFPSEKNDLKKFQKNNVTIDLNVLYAKKEKIYPSYVSKHNSNYEKQVILLMISNRQKLWDFLVAKKLSTLLRGITSKRHGDFYCLNWLHSFEIEKKLESHKKNMWK